MSALKKAFSRQSSAISLLIFTILFIANLFIFTSPVFAGCTNPGIGEWCPLDSKNYNDEIATQRFGRNVLVFGHVALFGTNPLNVNGGTYSEKVAYKTENGKIVAYSTPGIGTENPDGGALGLATNAIASLYNPPISSVEYLANLGENMGLAPKSAYAQVTGSGANVISPVLSLWQVMRNVAYVAFILVFVAAGLMIMFRQKLNPQTVIGIQQALPGLVIGLILVTFSYFIASFIVDLAFVGTRLVAEIFISTKAPNYYGCTVNCGTDQEKEQKNKEGILATYQQSDAFNLYQKAALRTNNIPDIFGQTWKTFEPKSDSNTGKKPDWWTTFLQSASGPTTGSFGIIIGLFSGELFPQIQSAGAGAVATLAAILVPLILGIALLIQFVRLIIALLMSYLQILIMVIFGPFLILFSAIPGRGGTLGYWLKALFANVLVFPAVFAGFLFAGMLLEWDAGTLSNANMPLFGGLDSSILKSLLAFGVLLGLPSIPNMVRETFGVKGPQGFTQAALGGFMGGVGVGKVGVGQVTAGRGQEWEAYQKAKTENKLGVGPPPTEPSRGTKVAGRVRGWLGIR